MPQIFLVGNKADCVAHAGINIDKVADLKNKTKSKLYNVSAKDDFGITQLFQDIAEKLYEEYSADQVSDSYEKQKSMI